MIPPDQAEIAAADSVDIRNHKRRPNVDWDIIEDESKMKRSNHASTTRTK